MSDEAHYIQESVFPYQPDPETPADKQKKEEYRQRLAEKLRDPEFREIEGFPLGTDEAILALSDPPYYTACPNPFLAEILDEWRRERRKNRKALGLVDDENLPPGMKAYQREPFAADVSEGKNDPIYNAHSYHTKVPHKAIMRYILHYTDPGDIVFDGFCGTGMTGVAAQLCGDRKVVESLGYRVDKKGVIYDGEKAISRLGVRKALLNDLSPAATFIAYNYNTPVDVRAFEREARRILAQVEKECGWMYETQHTNGVKGRINYTVWSDVFRCPHCGKEMVFWDVAVDQDGKSIRDSWDCPGCSSTLAKSPKKDSGALRVERVMDTVFDRALGKTIQKARHRPVLINYSLGKNRHEKHPDEVDIAIIKKIEDSDIPYHFPKEPMLFVGEGWGDTWRSGVHAGLTHVHHFYTQRNLWVLASYLNKVKESPNYIFWQSILRGSTSYSTKMVKVNVPRLLSNGGLFSFGAVTGTLYIPSLNGERPIDQAISGKIKSLIKSSIKGSGVDTLITTQGSSKILTESGLLDYIFVDPPFGGNLMYSELNFLSEAWLGVFTNNKPEAIINQEQKKGLTEYQRLMESCFSEFHRLLKPGHWMTVEFHNSQNSVWNAIQEALLRAGFMVADVRTLDKQQATFKQVTTTAAVKQDLVISAYKPTAEFEQSFSIEGGTTAGAWEFVRQHLEQLPMPSLAGDHIEVQGERMPYLLYDRMVAFHLVRGLTVPLSASEFYQGLSDLAIPRDGMYFTAAQVSRYDQMRLKADKVQQLPLFVTDEASAILWLRGELDNKMGGGPQTYSEISPKFIRQWHPEKYEKLPELLEILQQNFLQDTEDKWYVPDPDNAAHLEALRQRDLLRYFAQYTSGTGRIKVFRTEAVKAGFSKAWAEHRYADIVKVAERLPEQALQEDPKLKLYYDNALNRAPKEPKQGRLI